jgi:predicted kinase
MAAPSRRLPAQHTARQGSDVSQILMTIPDAQVEPNTAPVLILTIGLPGSGKSTFCRRLAPLIDAVILESDALRRLLFKEPTYTPTESRRLFDALHAAARELLTQGRNVIIDATSVKESDRQPVYEVADEAGARLIQLSFSAPSAVIEQRLSSRMETPAAEDNSSAGQGVYRRMVAIAEAPQREYWNVDTSDDETIDMVMNRLVEACRSSAGRVMGGTS